jgi:Arc/MetJ-type ribon-helix-helix transcriptional regulator
VSTQQIAIRLPDDLVEQLDDRVRQGAAANRTELIRVLLAREMRRDDVAAEVAVLASAGTTPTT